MRKPRSCRAGIHNRREVDDTIKRMMKVSEHALPLKMAAKGKSC